MVTEFLNTLIQVNEDAAHCIPLHPLYVNTGLPVDQLFAEVVVREDLVNIQRTDVSKSSNRHKNVCTPTDMFLKNDQPARNVYMLGQPGHGKTTFCLHLLQLWCTAKTIANTDLSLWQFGMYVFDFLFYVSLRHVDPCRSSIVDMICEDIFEEDDKSKDVIRHVLGCPDYRCLVIIDGLDEWVYSPEVKAKLRQDGFPNTRGISTNCTIFYSSRHWKVELIQPKYNAKDKMIEILGLSDKGVDTLIENILVNFFMLTNDSPDFEAKFIDAKAMLQYSSFKHFMKIPMLVTLSVFLEFDKNYVPGSCTSMFLDQIEILISRAVTDGRIKTDALDALDTSLALEIDTPKIVKERKLLLQFIPLFYNLGAVAYNDSVSKESNLVFKREMLEDAIGERQLDVALKVGIVNQMRAPGRFHVPKVSIEFLHKSIQEAMAALYIVCNKSDAYASLCKNCCTVEKVMEMSNVLHYISGFRPDIGCKFSWHISHVASSNQKLMHERNELNLLFGGQARMLYNLHYQCFKEMTHTLSLMSDSKSPIKYSLSDVGLRRNDNDTIIMTETMMRGSPESILSFSLWVDSETLWSAGPLLQVLTHCNNLTTLEIDFWYSMPDPELISVIPKLKYLERVRYRHFYSTGEDGFDFDSCVVRAIFQLTHLKHIHIEGVRLDENSLIVTADMAWLQKIELKHIDMIPGAWKSFVTSLRSVKHAVDVTIRNSNIDDGTINVVCISDYYTVIMKDILWEKIRFVSESQL